MSDDKRGTVFPLGSVTMTASTVKCSCLARTEDRLHPISATTQAALTAAIQDLADYEHPRGPKREIVN